MKIAYLGPAGTFTEDALREAAGPEQFEPLRTTTIHDAILAVQEGVAERALVPFENSIEGSVRNTLDTLAAEADAADRAGDRTAATRLEAERQALVGELSRAAGLAGRHRLAPLENERARVNVTRTLRAAIERIAPAAPGAAAHLRASVRTGTACRYEPAPGGPGRWHV